MIDQLKADAEKKVQSNLERLTEEFSRISVGRANPGLVINIKVKAYDNEFTLKELASVSTPQPTEILIAPWDKKLIPNLEKALRTSSGNFNPVAMEDCLRLPIPPLSEERRQELRRLVALKSEEAKVYVRNVRHEKIKSLDEMCDEKIISEDEHDRFRKDLQQIFDQANQRIDELRAKREEELFLIT